MKKIILLLACGLFSLMVNGQSYLPNYMLNPSSFIQNNCTVLDSSGWLIFDRNSEVLSADFLVNHKSNFGMGGDDSFILKSSQIDSFSFTTDMNRTRHDRYTQIFKGIEVEYAEFFIHSIQGKVVYTNCKVAENLNLSVNPSITESQALNFALNELGATNQYAWQNTDMENEIKTVTGNPQATYFPKGNLIIAKNEISSNYNPEEFTLAWKFEIYSISPDMNVRIYVNANTGGIIRTQNLLCENGNAQTLYYGNQPIDTKWRGFPYNDFVLKAEDNSRDITTKFVGNGPSFVGWNQVDDDDDQWWSNVSVATSSHWGVTQAWDFFKNVFGRNGTDGSGNNVHVWANWNNNHSDYVCIGGVDRIRVGHEQFSGNQHSDGTIDNLAHEFTHGITHCTANLENSNEPGALNESFSDIFGFMTERYYQPAIYDWTIGEDEGYVSRYMDFPGQILDPMKYGGPYWNNVNNCSPSSQNGYCYVHKNAGVQNFWFYLLSEGNPNNVAAQTLNLYNYTVTVTGIGPDKAANIAYYNLTNNLGCNSDYLDAANGSFMAAYTIYGNCSEEWKQTKNAWAAVGIGSPYNAPTIQGPTVIYHFSNGTIFGGIPKTYTATGSTSAGGYSWVLSGAPCVHSISGVNNNTFTISDFQSDFSSRSLQLNTYCQIITKNIYFKCIDCPLYHDDNGGNWQLKLYPNPTRDNIHITSDIIDNLSDEPIYITIISTSGYYAYQENFLHQIPDSIDVSSYASGLYTLILHQGDKIQTLRFTKL